MQKDLSFFQYYISAFARPARTFDAMVSDKRIISMGFRSVIIMAILYTGVYIFLIMGNGLPFHPWLKIPDDIYYRYNVFFCAPSMILGWILAAGLVHTTSRIFCTAGSFDQILGVFGFGIGVASWATGLHDIITSFLGAVKIINQNQYELAMNSDTIWRVILWILMLIYAAWFIILFSKGVTSVYRISPGKSVFLGTIGFFIYQLFFFIFNR